MGWKSPSRGRLNGWLMKYYKRSWKITKCMVDGVPHGLENGLEKSITGESKWMVDEVHALGS